MRCYGTRNNIGGSRSTSPARTVHTPCVLRVFVQYVGDRKYACTVQPRQLPSNAAVGVYQDASGELR
eukprot:353615-Chlamydomonas_euryale.AAC.22